MSCSMTVDAVRDRTKTVTRRHGWKDPARAAEIEHERYDLRRDTEHRYGHAAALDLLALASASAATVDGQLSLFEAAS